ncbi:MAG: PEP/pyruvate-binding domain-containing protein [Caldilineaceae bacterium]
MTTAPHRTKTLLPLNSPDASLATVGGKGNNLARLARGHFPVPGGFLLTTQAYDDFVAQDNLSEWIADQIRATSTDDPDALEATSAAIRQRFRQTPVPEDIAAAVCRAYAELNAPPVAVRSSATAEDLPDMSFAGQQDTYLNVLGEDALLDAVRNCWGSLWTARAIGYRSRNHIDHDQVSLAVVVQKMVQSDASGVLFTANPLNGSRMQTVIDATLGLGEALVSGLVEPDHYVVETASGEILDRHLGEKATVIRGVDGGGTQTEQRTHADRPALTDAQIRDLVILGRRVANFYDAPQDIEWAFADGVLYLLQARPITSLYPIPEGAPEGRLNVYTSFGAIQGMLDPMTPLGQDMIRGFFAGGAILFGYPGTTVETQGVLFSAGGRLWGKLDPLIRNGFSRNLFTKALEVVEPSTGQAIASILDDPRLAVQRDRPSPKTIVQHLLPPARAMLPVIVDGLRRPEESRLRFQAHLEETLRSIQDRVDRAPTLAGWVAVVEYVFYELVPRLLPLLVPRVGVGVAMLNRWLALTNPIFRADQTGTLPNPLEITRGLPHNVTTEMDLTLWTVATVIRQDAAAAKQILEGDAAQLAASYQAGTLPYVAQAAVAAFLDRYGARGLAEIDFGRTRWRENPVQVFQMVQNYLRIEDENMAPDVIFGRGAAAAEAAIERYASLAQQQPNGERTAHMIRWTAQRVQALAGLRKAPNSSSSAPCGHPARSAAQTRR